MLLCLGCGDSEQGPGPDESDAASQASGADGGEAGQVDGAVPSGVTACGFNLECDAASQVCVECNCGGPTSYECKPVPQTCAADRTCECLAADLCPGSTAQCLAASDNTILCETGLD